MKTKLLGMLTIMLGVFLCAGVAAASDADVLQPAGTITYNENLDVNGTIYTDSISIGQYGVGGVTCFNGSIVNVGEGVAVTIADPDGLRVDAGIYRSEIGGDRPVLFWDDITAGKDDTNNLGSEDVRWKKLFVKDADFTGAVDFTNATVTGLDPVAMTDADTLDGIDSTGFAAKAHNHDSRYYTEDESNSRFLNVAGDTMTGTLNLNGTTVSNGVIVAQNYITANNNINQNTSYGGAMKAMVYCASNGTLQRSWDTSTLYSATCTRTGTGRYTVDFNFAVDNRYIQITPVSAMTSQTFTQFLFAGALTDTIYVGTFDETGADSDSGFMITVY